MRKLLDAHAAEPYAADIDVLLCGMGDQARMLQRWQLAYFGFTRPRFRTFTMPAGIRYRVDVIDTWQMTVTEAPGRFEGTFTVELPARAFVAVRLRAVP